MHHDFIIIGGGIIGAATAVELKRRYPARRVLLLEKETAGGRHQTGHNSGVIHAGLYYRPGSHKSRFCRAGCEATIAFCEEAHIPYERCGKLIVAVQDSELAGLSALEARCRENGVAAERVDGDGIPRIEPAIRGLGAVRIPATGIVDFGRVCAAMLDRFRAAGGEIRFGCTVTAVAGSGTDARVETDMGRFSAGQAVVCAGLMSDRLARQSGLAVGFRIIPFRGEYYRLGERHRGLIRHLVYPVPDPNLPFLGIHITRRIDGSILIGPNAVPGWKREGYGRFNFDPVDTVETLGWPGFWRMLPAYWRQGVSEAADALWRNRYAARLRRYCPELGAADLIPGTAGIRAQAVHADGRLEDDFLFIRSGNVLHVCNAPSPAATSAIPIADHLCTMLENPQA